MSRPDPIGTLTPPAPSTTTVSDRLREIAPCGGDGREVDRYAIVPRSEMRRDRIGERIGIAHAQGNVEAVGIRESAHVRVAIGPGVDAGGNRLHARGAHTARAKGAQQRTRDARLAHARVRAPDEDAGRHGR